MAFLPRAGRHAAGPVWPLPAVPAAWHRAEPLIKQAPSTLCPPGHPRSLALAPDPSGEATRWAFREGRVPVGRGDWEADGKHPGLAAQARSFLLGRGQLLGWPQCPHLRAGGGPGQHSVVGGARGAQAPGWLVWQEAPVPCETVSKSAVVAASERRGPATPTGPGMRKELRECPGPGAQTVLTSWPRFNPSPGLPGPPGTSSEGPCPRRRAHTAQPAWGPT